MILAPLRAAIPITQLLRLVRDASGVGREREPPILDGFPTDMKALLFRSIISRDISPPETWVIRHTAGTALAWATICQLRDLADAVRVAYGHSIA